MLLFIAVVLIYGLKLHWGWYVAAVVMYGIHWWTILDRDGR